MTHQRNSKSGSPGGHVRIPHLLMDTDDYRNLGPNAVKLLNVMIYQYRGRNNGDLTAAWGYMKKFRFRSKETLFKAIKELVEANLIIRTRHGQFMNPGGQCDLFALAWLPIDECKGKRLVVAPTTRPPRKLSMENKK